MMFTHSRIELEAGLAQQVSELYHALDRGRGGPCGTWHSRRLNHNPYPWFQATYDRVVSAVGDLKIDEWWFNCGDLGDEYRWHEHNPYPWAAVLYIQTPENSGGIEFRRQDEYQVFQPTPGDFILFEGRQAHRVQKNNSTDYRISAAFNLK